MIEIQQTSTFNALNFRKLSSIIKLQKGGVTMIERIMDAWTRYVEAYARMNQTVHW